MDCGRCNEEIRVQEDSILCKTCKKVYHFECGALTEAIFRRMKPASKDAYKCPNCCKRGANLELPKTPIQDETRGNKENQSYGRDYLDRKFDQLTSLINENKDDVIRVLNEKVTLLENKLQEKDTKLVELEEKIIHLENRSRICNIEVRNFPETNGENVYTIAQEIGKAIGVEKIEPGDIQVAHRVSTKNANQRKRPIIIHLRSRYLRNIWLTKYRDFKKSLGKNKTLNSKQVNQHLPPEDIFIHEHITVETKILLNEVKKFASEKGIKYVWVKDAFILLKRNDSSMVTKLQTKREFESFKTNFH